MSNVNSVGNNLSNYLYSSIASGSRIQTASNGPSELAVLQRQERQVRGSEVGTSNVKEAKAAANIADGALSGINDSLQRIRELAVHASNGLLTSEDKSYIQTEIDQLKAGIADTANSANYNGIPLLNNEDGKVFEIASDSDGGKMKLGTMNSTLEALGIADFDVTNDFDLKTIDSAMEKINKGRSDIGAQTNSFDVAVNYNNGFSYNTESSRSRIGDTDYGKYVGKLKTQQLLKNVQFQMQKSRQKNEEKKVKNLFK